MRRLELKRCCIFCSTVIVLWDSRCSRSKGYPGSPSLRLFMLRMIYSYDMPVAGCGSQVFLKPVAEHVQVYRFKQIWRSQNIGKLCVTIFTKGGSTTQHPFIRKYIVLRCRKSIVCNKNPLWVFGGNIRFGEHRTQKERFLMCVL